MSRFDRRGPQQMVPHLDVRSKSLVYLTGVPTNIGGKELKRRLNNQFGRVKFVETFEAWLGQRTGNMVIDFTTYDDSEAFMTAVINGRITFLEGAGIQHIGIVGARHFFELIHRNTDVDLFDCDGRPSGEWRSNCRQNRPTGGPKPYDRPSPRNANATPGSGSNRIPIGGPSAGGGSRPRNETSFNAVGGGMSLSGGSANQSQNSTAGCGRERDRNSPSDDEETVGPFPTSSSGAIRRLVKYSVWESRLTGRTHFLQFFSPCKNNQNDNYPLEPMTPPSPVAAAHNEPIGRRRSRTPLPFSPRKMANASNLEGIDRQRSASVSRPLRHSTPNSSPPPPSTFMERISIVSSLPPPSVKQQKEIQFPKKKVGKGINEYNFAWSRGHSPAERRGRDEEMRSRLPKQQNSTSSAIGGIGMGTPMVVGLDLTKKRMRQERRRHHRYFRTPSPQWLSQPQRRPSRSRSRHLPPPPHQSSSSSSGHTSRRSSFGRRFSSPFHGDGGLFMFRALSGTGSSKLREIGRQFKHLQRDGVIWPKLKRAGPQKWAKKQSKGNNGNGSAGSGPDIILLDDSSLSSASSGIGPSFAATPGTNSSKNASKPLPAVKKPQNLVRRHRNPDELEDGELSEESEGQNIDDGGEMPMEIDGQGEEENAVGHEEEEDDLDMEEPQIELVDDDDEEEVRRRQKQKEEEAMALKLKECASKMVAAAAGAQQNAVAEEGGEALENADGQSNAEEENGNEGDQNEGEEEDILAGESVVDSNEIDEAALLDASYNEEDEEGENGDSDEGDLRPISAQFPEENGHSPQNQQIDKEDDESSGEEIVVLGIRRISIDDGDHQRAAGNGPIGIGRRGPRIKSIKREIGDAEEDNGQSSGQNGEGGGLGGTNNDDLLLLL